MSNQIQDRLVNILELIKENAQPFPDKLMVEKPTVVIPNDPLSSEKSDIKTEGIFIDDNYFDNIQFFPQPSTDNRKDFEIEIDENDLMDYKSPLLTTVNISRKNLKQILNNILEDLNDSIRDFKTPDRSSNRRIKKVKKLINTVSSKEKQYF